MHRQREEEALDSMELHNRYLAERHGLHQIDTLEYVLEIPSPR